MIQKTFTIIKPDAVAQGVIGEINARFEKRALHIIAMKMARLSVEQAEHLYIDHKGKHFYDNLVKFITSGPAVMQVLEGVEAVRTAREVMGATNPAMADPGTLRADFGNKNKDLMHENVIHGSDSVDSAEAEIKLFFSSGEIYPRSYS